MWCWLYRACSQYIGHCLPLLNGKSRGLGLRGLETCMGKKFGLVLVVQEWIMRRVADGLLLCGLGFALAYGLPRAPGDSTGSPRGSWRPWNDKRLRGNRFLDLPGWLAPRWRRRLQTSNRHGSRLLVLASRHNLGRFLRTPRRRTRNRTGPGRGGRLVGRRSNARPEQLLLLRLSLPGMNDLPALSKSASLRDDRVRFVSGFVDGGCARS